jgi:peptidoglycan/LPS O-acetylase OafA/YrhL
MSTLAAGVTLFFTLSGFLLYRPFAAAIARAQPPPSIRGYLRNRFLRIAPAYWVILAATTFVLGAVSLRDATGALLVGRLTSPSVLAPTFLLVQQYNPATIMSGIGPAWSLAVEVVFYLVLPVLVVPVARLAPKAASRGRRVLLLCGPAVLLLVVGLSGKAVAAFVVPGRRLAGYSANWHSVIERSFWAQADLFAFGMLVAVAYVEANDGRLTLPRRWRGTALAIAIAVFLPCAVTMHRAEHSYLPQNTGEALAIALAFMIIVMPREAGKKRSWIVGVLESRPLVSVGLVSYSLFLWHYPVLQWLKRQGLTVDGIPGLVVNSAIVAVVAGSLSLLTYRWVELPALRRKRRTIAEPEAVPREETRAPAVIPVLAPPVAAASAREVAIPRLRP